MQSLEVKPQTRPAVMSSGMFCAFYGFNNNGGAMLETTSGRLYGDFDPSQVLILDVNEWHRYEKKDDSVISERFCETIANLPNNRKRVKRFLESFEKTES